MDIHDDHTTNDTGDGRSATDDALGTVLTVASMVRPRPDFHSRVMAALPSRPRPSSARLFRFAIPIGATVLTVGIAIVARSGGAATMARDPVAGFPLSTGGLPSPWKPLHDGLLSMSLPDTTVLTVLAALVVVAGSWIYTELDRP